MICVFDSSVWISALQFGGTPLESLHQAIENYQVAICAQILHETCAALTGRFDWSDARLDAALSEFLGALIEVNVLGQLVGICRDPKDDMVLECAVAAGADVIVTGDKDLLALSEYKSIRILTPRAFLDEFSS